MEKCAIYARVSSIEQTKGLSIEDQIKDLSLQCEMRSIEYEIFEDAGKSAKHDTAEKRPEWDRLLESVKEQKFQYVCARDFPRLARNVKMWRTFSDAVIENGVILIISGKEFDLRMPQDSLMATILAGFAQYDNSVRAEASLRSKKLMVEKGYIPGFRRPYGYNIVGEKCKKTLEKNSEEAGIVRKIADWLLGGFTLNDVVVKLHKEKIAPLKEGNRWCYQTISYIVKNPMITGKYIIRGKKIKGSTDEINFEAIITKEEQEKIRKQLFRNKAALENKRHYKHFFEDGKLKCGRCGSSLRAQFTHWTNKDGTRSRNFRLYCVNRWQTDITCDLSPLNGDELQKAIWNDIVDMLQNPDSLIEEYKKQTVIQNAHALTLISSEKDVAKVIEEKKALKNKLLDLKDFRIDVIKEKVNLLDDEIKTLAEEQKSLQQRFEKIKTLEGNLEVLNSFVKKMKRSYKFTEDAKIALLDVLIKEITLDYIKGNLEVKMTLNIPELDKNLLLAKQDKY